MYERIIVAIRTCARANKRGQVGFFPLLNTLRICSLVDLVLLYVHENQAELLATFLAAAVIKKPLPPYRIIAHQIKRTDGRVPHGHIQHDLQDILQAEMRMRDIGIALDDDYSQHSSKILDPARLSVYKKLADTRNDWALSSHGVLFGKLDKKRKQADEFYDVHPEYKWSRSYATPMTPTGFVKAIRETAEAATLMGVEYFTFRKNSMSRASAVRFSLVPTWSQILGLFKTSPNNYDSRITQCEDWKAADTLLRARGSLGVLQDNLNCMTFQIEPWKYAPNGTQYQDRRNNIDDLLSGPKMHGLKVWLETGETRMKTGGNEATAIKMNPALLKVFNNADHRDLGMDASLAQPVPAVPDLHALTAIGGAARLASPQAFRSH